MSRTLRENGIHVQQNFAIDLTATGAPTDIALTMIWPGTGAMVLDWLLHIDTVGIGDGTHTVRLEHGLTTDGVAATTAIVIVDATAFAAETIAEGEGLGTQPSGGSVAGTATQIKNVESVVDITDGVIADVLVRFLL